MLVDNPQACDIYIDPPSDDSDGDSGDENFGDASNFSSGLLRTGAEIRGTEIRVLYVFYISVTITILLYVQLLNIYSSYIYHIHAVPIINTCEILL